MPWEQYYPEHDWMNLHPVSGFVPISIICVTDYLFVFLFPFQHSISLQIRLPNDPSKPEYKLDGSVVSVPDLPLSLLISILRDRILQHPGSAVPASRTRLACDNKTFTNANTLASYNLEDEDLLVAIISSCFRCSSFACYQVGLRCADSRGGAVICVHLGGSYVSLSYIRHSCS